MPARGSSGAKPGIEQYTSRGLRAVAPSVGAVDESSRRLSGLCRLQVKRDPAFAALEERISIRVPRWTVRRIDMDDIGTLIRKHDGSQRASNVLAEVDHA